MLTMASAAGDPSRPRDRDKQAPCDCKCKQNAASRKGHKLKKYPLAEKEKIIKLIEEGYKTCEIVRHTGCPESTVRTFRKRKDDIKKTLVVAKSSFSSSKAGTSQAFHNYGQRNLAMFDGKCKRNTDNRKGQKLKKYSVAEKEKIIKLIDEGYKNCEIVRLTGSPESTVRTFRKQKDNIKKILTVAKSCFASSEAGASRAVHFYGHRNLALVLTEYFLQRFLKRQFYEGVSVSLKQLQVKARSIYKKVCIKKKIPNPLPFNASPGWINSFKTKYNIKCVVYQGQVSSADQGATDSFLAVTQAKPNEMPLEKSAQPDPLAKTLANVRSVSAPRYTDTAEENTWELLADSVRANNIDEVTEGEETEQTKKPEPIPTKSITSQQLSLLLGRLDEITEVVQTMNLEQEHQNSILTKVAQITKEVEDIYKKKLHNSQQVFATHYIKKTQETCKQEAVDVIENFDFEGFDFDFEGFEVKVLGNPE